MQTLNIPEHPAIARVLATGYPYPVQEPDEICCSVCTERITGKSKVYLYDGEPMCEFCCGEAIRRDLTVSNLAELIGIDYMSADDYAGRLVG